MAPQFRALSSARLVAANVFGCRCCDEIGPAWSDRMGLLGTFSAIVASPL